jgi:2-iminoacetate synthase
MKYITIERKRAMAIYNPKSLKAEEFINDGEILDTIAYAEANKNNKALIEEILEKARPKKTADGTVCAGLSHREAALLLLCDDPELTQKMYKLAEEIKLAFYGNRIVMFAPLYLSNYCVNGCVYCPYHLKNKHIARKKLTQDEVRAEVIALQDMGHKRLAIEAGEDPVNNPIEYILECINTIYSVKHKNGAIRRVNVNIAATTVENYRKLKEAGIGTYILFQETYHKESYLKLHPTGPKHDYDYHTEAMDRAMEGGIDDVGLGVLFGLELYKYEFVGLMMHAEHLEAVHGVGPHTISVPRIKRADDIDPNVFDNSIPDDVFAKIIACIRIAVPYTGMIISTRESEEVRGKALNYGISQISGASRTSVGGYTEEERPHDSEQFDVSDQRTLDEVVAWLMKLGHIPSFCTACYREGRTGDRFMMLCKNGQILNCCHPNALMTLTEYLIDYASEETRKIGFELIDKELEKIPNEKVKGIAKDNIEAIKSSNRRDFRF